MPGRGSRPAGGAAALTADEFAERFQGASRVLWTLAAGILGDPSEAHDVLQEASVMALAKLERFESGTNFTAWMASFVRNVARNHARKSVRRATRPADPVGLGEAVEAPRSPASERPPVDGRGELEAGQDAFDDGVLCALRELAPVARACLLLRTVLDLSYKEIARALEIPEGTAMSHVHRSRTAMRRMLEARELEDGGLEMGNTG